MEQNTKEKQFTSLIEEYKRVIYKICYMYATDGDNFKDLYQDVVINLWKGFEGYEGKGKLSSWIYRVGLNTCISFFRKSNSRPVVVPITIDLESAFADEEEKTSQLRLLKRLINMLGKLERALILLWLEERSHQEIADILGISKNYVAVKLYRIKENLKNMSNS